MQDTPNANIWSEINVGLPFLLEKALAALSCAAGSALAINVQSHEPVAFFRIGEGPEQKLSVQTIEGQALNLGQGGSVVQECLANAAGVQVHLLLHAHHIGSNRVRASELRDVGQACCTLLECGRVATTARQSGREIGFVGISQPFQKLVAKVKRVAAVEELPAFISGERGSGKEAVAYAIHYFSSRRERPFIAINSAVLSDELFAAQLFGFRKGSFTGAFTDRSGILEAVNGGTLFLDEVTEAPRSFYAGLLRLLDYGEVQKIGDHLPSKVHVRIVAATNRDIEKLVSDGEFPADLYDRLNVLPVTVPPLRERKIDIPILATHFLRLHCPHAPQCHGHRDCRPCLGDGLATALQEYSWPGNVRELRNWIVRLVAGEDERPFRMAGLSVQQGNSAGTTQPPLEAAIRSCITLALKKANWNRSAAARSLGLPLSTLISKMKRFNIGCDESSNLPQNTED